MIRFEPLCLCTNSVPGKDLFHALDLARACGFTYVELAAIDGISEQVNVDLLTDEALGQIRASLESRGLACFAVSGHCDMTDPPSFRRLLQKLRFAGAVGARFLNTRCGPPERYDVFLKNVREAAALARGRDYVNPEDVSLVFPDVVPHRLLLSPRAEAEGFDPAAELLAAVPAPRVG